MAATMMNSTSQVKPKFAVKQIPSFDELSEQLEIALDYKDDNLAYIVLLRQRDLANQNGGNMFVLRDLIEICEKLNLKAERARYCRELAQLTGDKYHLIG